MLRRDRSRSAAFDGVESVKQLIRSTCMQVPQGFVSNAYAGAE